MAPAGFKLGDDTVHVKGRSSAKAQELLTLAADKGIDPSLIQTTSVGYLVPKALVEDVKLEGDEDQETADGDLEAYDPTQHTIAEVTEYLEGVDEAERARVIAAEQESEKPRKGVLDLADTGEEAK